MSVDPKLTLLELLKGGWTLATEPGFTGDWLDAEASFPHVTVTHVHTAAEPLGFSEDVPAASRRLNAVYMVDVWSRGDPGMRWDMLREVDRILKSRMSEPGGGLESLRVHSWRDLDEGHRAPPLYRSQVQLEVKYYG